MVPEKDEPIFNVINMAIWWRIEIFHDGGRYHIETSPLTCRANQWTGFYMISASVMKELNIKIRAENKANIAAFLESILNWKYCLWLSST